MNFVDVKFPFGKVPVKFVQIGVQTNRTGHNIFRGEVIGILKDPNCMVLGSGLRDFHAYGKGGTLRDSSRTDVGRIVAHLES